MRVSCGTSLLWQQVPLIVTDETQLWLEIEYKIKGVFWIKTLDFNFVFRSLLPSWQSMFWEGKFLTTIADVWTPKYAQRKKKISSLRRLRTKILSNRIPVTGILWLSSGFNTGCFLLQETRTSKVVAVLQRSLISSRLVSISLAYRATQEVPRFVKRFGTGLTHQDTRDVRGLGFDFRPAWKWIVDRFVLSCVYRLRDCRQLPNNYHSWSL